MVTTASIRLRISRWVVTVLALASLTTIIPPVLTPQYATVPAQAADANPFPVISGMVRYLAESFTAGSTSWPSTAGNNPVAITGSALTREITAAGTFGASKSVPAVRGLSTTSLTWPSAILNTSAYTFITVARYAPSSPTFANSPSCANTATHGVANTDKRNRIFSSLSGNWLHGFWACASGVNFRDGWFTQNAETIPEMAGNKVDNWILNSECGFISGGTSDCNGQFRAFGVNRTIATNNYNRGYQVVINGGAFPLENSDFQIAEVIAYPTILSVANVIKIETYLARQYGITLSASAATKLAVYTPSVGSSLGQAFTTQPQIVVQDANGQTVTTNNSTIITATITGAGGALIGTQTADVVQGVATFENLGVTGTTDTTYTITYSASPALTATSEVRTFTRGPRTAALTLSRSALALGETAVATISTSPSSNSDGTITFTAAGNACSVVSATGVVTATRPDGLCSISATISSGSSYDAATTPVVQISVSTVGSEVDSALSLNGTSQYAWVSDTGTGGVFDIRGAITLQAWVYPTHATAGIQYTVASKSNAYQIFHKEGIWRYGLWGSTSWGDGISTTVPVVLDEWHHVAITRIAATNEVNFYYDGVLAFTGTANTAGTSTIADNSLPFAIGGLVSVGPSLQHGFRGSIDHVAIFDVARDAAAIRSDMHTYIQPNTVGLRHYFDMNGSNGSLLFNRAASSVSASDLALVSAPGFPDVKEATTSGVHNIVKFPRSYLTSRGGWQVPDEVNTASALVIAGGGGGGSRVGGGGGAGGFLYQQTLSLVAGAFETITVGQGGFGGRTGNRVENNYQGVSGQNSIFGNRFTLIGGGGGGGYHTDTNTGHEGKSGGSGGGAAPHRSIAGTWPAGIGLTVQNSTFGYGLGNNGGSGFSGTSGFYPAGGGGGSAGVGATATSNSTPGNGGQATLDPILGTTTCYAGGGGGGVGDDFVGDIGGAAGSCAGGVATAGNGSKDRVVGGSAQPNSGSGGGGSGYETGALNSLDKAGGNGGSGVIIFKFILLSTKPIFTGPISDTTTAGLTHTFTVGGSPSNPMVRSFLWQSSTDTGTTWSAISIGIGFTNANYTTPILETTTSGPRYQYRVVVSDSDTAGANLVETSSAVFLIINPRIIITGAYTPAKYGNTTIETFTVQSNTGTGTKTIKRTSPARTFITWDTATVNTARVTVAPQLIAGTYYDTLTVTDQKLATTILAVTIIVLKADTVTVTVAGRNDTYTASSLSYTDSFTVTGLVAGDSLTSVSYLYTGTANDGTSFSNAARPAIAGQYVISPLFTLLNSASYESVTVTSGTLTINRKLRTVTINTKPASLKYGDTSTVIAGTVDGASDGALSYQSSTASLCQFSGAILQAIEAVGNCQYTATISRGNNFETATSTINTTTLALADTLTVTVLPITPLTYTGNQAVVSPRISVTGFKLNDTTTATSASFSYRTAGTNNSFPLTAPTNSDTYTVRADTLTVTVGSLARYRAITYIDGTLRINRALQSHLVLAQYSAIFGDPYRIIFYGGSGLGSVTQSVSNGNASNCTLSGDTITTTSAGSCLLTLTKAQDQNFETATVSSLIYFLLWVAPPLPTIGSGATISLNSTNEVTVNLDLAPMISSLSTYTATAGVTSLVITGLGFNGSDALFEISFFRGVNGTGFAINPEQTQITVTVPAGARTGKVLVVTSKGSATSELSLAITP